MIKKLLDNKALLAVTFLVLGIVLGVLGTKAIQVQNQFKADLSLSALGLKPDQNQFNVFPFEPKQKPNPGQNPAQEDSDEPQLDSMMNSMADAKKLRDQMIKQFQQNTLSFFEEDDDVPGLFGDESRLGAGHQVTEREDKKFHYIEILIQDLSPEKVQVRIEDGQMTISGRIEKKTQSPRERGDDQNQGKSVTTISSSFEKSFPIPAGVQADSATIEQKAGALVVKFLKNN